MIRKLSIALLLATLFSCAGSYKTINPERLAYGTSRSTEGAEYATITNVLSETGNKKYANRELKRPLKLYAVKFTNKSDRTINFRNDVKISMGSRPVFPLESTVIHQSLKQPAGLYMLWGLLWVFITTCENDDCSSIPLPVGLVIGIGNTSVASSSNKKFLSELNNTNLLDRTIGPGETVTGLLGVSGDVAGPISFEIK
ncbi:MAG: hypothetical protein JNK44_10355 [Cyclobacteriaceae bacterium]|nr:hypothetical protein [Cyclobacteriaceae bacterium]